MRNPLRYLPAALGLGLLGMLPPAYAAAPQVIQSAGPIGGRVNSTIDTRVLATRVMCIGDSNTEGVQGYASYRYPLWFELRMAGYPVSFVGTRFTVENENGTTIPDLNLFGRYYTYFDRDHQAYSGYRTDQVLPLIAPAVANETPEVVLIMLGTNDVGQRGSIGATDGVTNIYKIIQAVRSQAPATIFFVASIPPIEPGTWYHNNAGYVAAFNYNLAAQIPTWNTALSPVTFVDVHGALNPATDLLADGLHLNVTGQNAAAHAFRLAISSVFTGGYLPSPVTTTVIQSQSFEGLGLADGINSNQSLPGWIYPSSPAVSTFVLNPDASTYTGAAGSGTPTGADGDEVLAMQNNTGGDPSLDWVYQILPTTMEFDATYLLSVAVGNRAYGNSLGTSSFGGYEIQLLAGNLVVASTSNVVTPVPGTFQSTALLFQSHSVNPRLVGSPMSVRMRLTYPTAQSATDFDKVELTKL
ncbi:MAG: hypothetical protein KDB61_10935 [Planctomycetes bacterium]|nr:hypothetical protein [Planctomycetota bacterium]